MADVDRRLEEIEKRLSTLEGLAQKWTIGVKSEDEIRRGVYEGFMATADRIRGRLSEDEGGTAPVQIRLSR